MQRPTIETSHQQSTDAGRVGRDHLQLRPALVMAEERQCAFPSTCPGWLAIAEAGCELLW